jgi:hypothetical protein
MLSYLPNLPFLNFLANFLNEFHYDLFTHAYNVHVPLLIVYECHNNNNNSSYFLLNVYCVPYKMLSSLSIAITSFNFDLQNSIQ